MKRLKPGRIEISVLCALLVSIIVMSCADCTAFAQQCGDIRTKVFRLHVLANSDSAYDQSLKLKVRDRILTEYGQDFGAQGDKDGAEALAKADIESIRRTAQDEVEREGCSYKVGVAVENTYFNTRTYGGCTLPAGKYDALRVTIGSAKGHNWWCVLFPPMCVASAQGSEKLGDVLTPEENSIVTSPGKYAIKFKIVEFVQSLRSHISSGRR